MRRLHDKLHGPYKPNARVYISESMRQDLEVWASFLAGFNGIALIKYDSDLCPASITIATDASLSGFGGHWGTSFISGVFPKSWKGTDIEAFEMFAVLTTVGSFVNRLKNRVVLLHCDNEALVYCLNKLTSKNKSVMKLLRGLVTILLSHNIKLHVTVTFNGVTYERVIFTIDISDSHT